MIETGRLDFLFAGEMRRFNEHTAADTVEFLTFRCKNAGDGDGNIAVKGHGFSQIEVFPEIESARSHDLTPGINDFIICLFPRFGSVEHDMAADHHSDIVFEFFDFVRHQIIAAIGAAADDFVGMGLFDFCGNSVDKTPNVVAPRAVKMPVATL